MRFAPCFAAKSFKSDSFDTRRSGPATGRSLERKRGGRRSFVRARADLARWDLRLFLGWAWALPASDGRQTRFLVLRAHAGVGTLSVDDPRGYNGEVTDRRVTVGPELRLAWSGGGDLSRFYLHGAVGIDRAVVQSTYSGSPHFASYSARCFRRSARAAPGWLRSSDTSVA